MACSKSLRTTFLAAADAGGSWSLIGYNPTGEAGPWSGGGNWPWFSEADDNPTVDFDNIQQGYYRLEYYKAGACPDNEYVTVPVRGGSAGDAGPTVVNVCTEDAVVNIWAKLVEVNNAVYDEGVLEVEGSYTGSLTSNAGYSAGAHFTESTFDPSLSPTGTFVVTANLDPVDVSGYLDADCVNCDSKTTTIWFVVSDPKPAGGDTEVQLCHSAVSRVMYNDLTGTKDPDGNWAVISGEASAYSLSADNNGQNDEFDPFQTTPPGTHISEYTTNTNLGCPGKKARLTYDVIKNFNTGGGTFNPIDNCAYSGNGNEVNVRTVYDAWLADQGQPPTDPGGRWLYWGHRYTDCVDAWNSGDIGVDGGACQGFGAFQEIGGGDDPLVLMNCEPDTACVGLIYASPTGVACGGSNLVIFAPSGCGACTCEASISATDCTATVSVTNCVNPVYQWQEYNGTNWVDLSGETGTSYVGTHGQQVRCHVTDDNCTEFPTNSLVLSCQVNCPGGVTISNNGCALSSAINNITTPTYQWQSQPIGGGSWSNIGGATSSTYNASTNNNYRLRVIDSANSCEYFSNTITINVSVTASINSCIASAAITGSLGSPTYQWQTSAVGAGSWSNIGGATSSQYESTQNEDLRVQVSFNGGCTFTSNTVTSNCGGGGGCTINIDSIVVDGCNIVATYSGNTGTPTIQWAGADINNTPGDCNGSSGWNAAGVGTVDNSVPGTTRLTPAQGERCYRVIVDDGDGCIDVAHIWFEPCCSDGADIAQETCDYEIRSYKLGDTGDANGAAVDFVDDQYLRWRVGVQAYKKCGADPYAVWQGESVCQILRRWTACPYQIGGTFGLEINEYIEDLRISIWDGGSETTHDLDLSAVVYTGQSAAAFTSALESEIQSELTALGLTAGSNYNLLRVLGTLSGGKMLFQVWFGAKDMFGVGKWAGADKDDMYLRINGGASPREFTSGFSQQGFSSDTPQVRNRTTDCGTIVQVTVEDTVPDNAVQINHAASNYHTITYTTNDGTHAKSFNPETSQCIKLTATGTGGCTAVSYLWSTGETSQVIYVEPGIGSVSVTVTCSDGCEYMDSISV